jgi:hypothetical protein
MDLFTRFAQVASSNIVRANTLEVNKRYPITYAQRQETVYGPTVLLTLRTSDSNESVKLFLPKRYGLIFKDEDITKINDGTLSLHLVYHGLYLGSRAYKMTLEY